MRGKVKRDCRELDTDESKKALSYRLLQRDIPALIIELGEPYVVNGRNVDEGVKAVLSVLSRLEMIEYGGCPDLQVPESLKG